MRVTVYEEHVPVAQFYAVPEFLNRVIAPLFDVWILSVWFLLMLRKTMKWWSYRPGGGQALEIYVHGVFSGDCSVIEVCHVVCCQIVINSRDICQYHGYLGELTGQIVGSRGHRQELVVPAVLSFSGCVVGRPLVVDGHAETAPNWFLCCHSVPVKCPLTAGILWNRKD